MNDSDLVRLQHMLDASREALSFLDGCTLDDLKTDRMRALALVKELEIIGEAASKVSEEVRVLATDIPWPIIVGMRNRLIHAYFDVSIEIVWTTATSKLPELIERLESLLSLGVKRGDRLAKS